MKTYLDHLRRQLQTQAAPLRMRYEQLAARERLMVIVAGVVIALALVYLLVWEPFAHARTRAEAALADSRDLAQQIELVGARAHSGQGGGALASRDASLLSAVDLATKSGTLGKAPSRLQPDGDNQVRVWLDGVSFDALVRWMYELQTRYGVRVDQVDIEGQSTAGTVNARLSLVRGS